MAGNLIQGGRFVTVATPGDYGKPRPGLVMQSDLFNDLPSFVICPLTKTLRTDADQFRINVALTSANGLREMSQIAIDKSRLWRRQRSAR